MSEQTTTTATNETREAQKLKERLITIDGKPYLGKENALTLFRHDYPASETRGVINTIMLSADPPIFRTEIIIDGVMVATGHASPEGKSQTFRKVETASIRRALENAGYGTRAVIERIADLIGTEQGKTLLGSGDKRRMGANSGGGKHWALNGGRDRMNKLMHELGFKWDDINDDIEPGKTLETLSATTLTEAAFEARLRKLKKDQSHQSSATPTPSG